MTTKREPVYILIPVHNRKAITLKCLETLKQNGDLDYYYVVVIDDGSTDGTGETINSLYPEVTVLKGDGNLWWTGAIKMGMEYAYQQGAEYLIWLNDDCLVAKKAIQDLVSFCEQNPQTIIGYQGYQLTNHQQIAFGGHRKNHQFSRFFNQPLFEPIDCPHNSIIECDMLGGNLVCLPKNIIDIIGLPQANLYPHYLGDFIYLTLAQKKGFKIYVSNQYYIFNTLARVSRLEAQRWLFQEGQPWEIIKLMFTPQSIISWRVWLIYHLVEHGSWQGIFNFIAYYNLRFTIPIILITILRFLPLSFRYKLSKIKHQIMA